MGRRGRRGIDQSGGNNVGFSVNRYDSLYGVPVRYSLDPAVEAEAPRIDVAQTRVDTRAEIDTGWGFLAFDSASAPAIPTIAIASWTRTARSAPASSTRAMKAGELVQTTRDGWGGLLARRLPARHAHRRRREVPAPEFDREGRTVHPPDRSTSARSRPRRRHATSIAALSAQADPDIGNPRFCPRVRRLSASVGASYEVAPRIRIGLNASHSERAPSAEELLPTARTRARRRLRPAIRISGPKRRGGWRRRSRRAARAGRSTPPPTTAGSNPTSTRPRPGRCGTIFRSSNIFRADARYFGSSWKAR